MVGLVEFDGYYANDIAEYRSLASLPNVPLQNVLLDGFNGVPITGANAGNSEVALDIEMVISVAPGLSSVVVYEAGPNGNANDVLSAMAANTAIKQFGCSWDFGTTPRGTMDSLFQKMAIDGQSFFNASGDNGAFTGDWPEPDDDPYITLVGGTTLATCAPGGAWLSETAWNVPDYAEATSGGYTANYTIALSAPWQQGINMTVNQGSTTLRNIPDVAMVAEDIVIVADNGHDHNILGHHGDIRNVPQCGRTLVNGHVDALLPGRGESNCVICGIASAGGLGVIRNIPGRFGEPGTARRAGRQSCPAHQGNVRVVVRLRPVPGESPIVAGRVEERLSVYRHFLEEAIHRPPWSGAKIPGTAELFDRGIGGHGARNVVGVPVRSGLINHHAGQPGSHGNHHFNVQGDFRIARSLRR